MRLLRPAARLLRRAAPPARRLAVLPPRPPPRTLLVSAAAKRGPAAPPSLTPPPPPPPPAADESEVESLYLDVDVTFGEDAPELASELAAVAAELEAGCPALLQAVLEEAPEESPPPLRALQTHARGAELSVCLASEEAMRALNAAWRATDSATDVLSFPLLEPAPSSAAGYLLPHGHAALGDVVICVPVAARQAAARGVSLEEELQTLLVHGLLHLLGYDHEGAGAAGAAEAAAMERAERRSLARLGWGGSGLVGYSREAEAESAPPAPPPAAAALPPAPAAAPPRPRAQPAFDLVFVDLDGTLLDSRGRVAARSAAALRALSACGTEVVVATGKARPAALAALAASGLSAPGGLLSAASPGVFLNGVLVHGPGGGVIYRRELEAGVCAEALTLAREAGVPACAFSGDACAALAPSPLLEELHERYFEPRATVAASLDALLAGPPSVKVLMYAQSAAEIDALRPRVEAAMAGRATVVQAVPEMLEVLPLGVSKGASAQRLLRALGLHPSRCAAIGDGENDVALLQAVGLGLAMANAAPVARAAASHTLSRGNDDGGVEEAVERFLLR